MRREIPLRTAVVIIIIATVIIFAVMWGIFLRKPAGEGVAPVEFMPKKPPYAPGEGVPKPPGKPF